MGLLFAVFLGILAIIVIARIASKARPREEQFTEVPPLQAMEKPEDAGSVKYEEITPVEALVSLLIRRGVITEEELLEEIARTSKYKDID